MKHCPMLAILIKSRDPIQYEPHYEKTGFLQLRKQRRRSAAQ